MKSSRLAAGPRSSREPTQFGMDSGGRRGGGRSAWASEKRGGDPSAAAGSFANILLMVLGFAALALVVVPWATGSHTYTMLTNSMAPKYSPGTFLVVKPAAFSELKYGDIVTFQLSLARPEVETQRIVGFGATQEGEKILITKGDNNAVNDPMPVRGHQIKGKVFYAVPLVSYLADALGNADRELWMKVAAVGLIGVGALLIFRTIRRRRAAGRNGSRRRGGRRNG
jgi:signal peptidase